MNKSTRELLNSFSERDLELLLPEEKAELERLLRARELLVQQQESRDLASFAKLAWPVLEPGTALLWNWHLDLICEYLTLVKQRTIRRLIFNVPPQTMKSRLVNVFYPVWTWTQIPTRRFLSSSYSGDLSTFFNRERARLVKSAWFQEMWPNLVSLVTDKQEEIESSVGGRMTATSTGGTATGKGAHDVIIDDPLNPGMAASELELKGSNQFFDETLRSRLSDQITGAFVIVMQRLNTQDLTGHVMERDPGTWLQIRLPMEAEEDERWEFPISGRVVERKEGDPLWPERYPPEVIKALKINSYVWAGQYQQRPTPREGNIIKQDWIRYWTRATYPERFDEIIQSWDMAFEKTDTSSYVVGQVWGRCGARKLLLAEEHERLDFVDTKKRVAIVTERWPMAHVKLVEKKANGPAVIADLRATISGLIAVEPDGDKTARMMAVSPEYESGCVEYPDPAMAGYEWVREHVAEILRFPQKPNDRGDAESQALRRLRLNVGGIFEYYKQLAEKTKNGNDEKPSEPERNTSGNGDSHVVPVEKTTTRVVYGLS